MIFVSVELFFEITSFLLAQQGPRIAARPSIGYWDEDWRPQFQASTPGAFYVGSFVPCTWGVGALRGLTRLLACVPRRCRNQSQTFFV